MENESEKIFIRLNSFAAFYFETPFRDSAFSDF